MRKTTIVLLALCLTTFVGAAPAAAEEPIGEPDDESPCVRVHLNPPDVIIDPSCIDDLMV